MDLVIANQILEHTKEIFWIFNEISRVLRIGGRMIIGVPNLASLHNRILLLLGRQPSPIKSTSAHVRGFTRSDLMRFMECWPGGYRLIDFQGSNFYPFPSLIARPLARCLPTMAWGIFLLVEKTRAYDGAFVRFPVDHKLETNFYLGKTLQL
ncbi:MAG: class I SAM-dependent methyltransferase, partial [Thermodesulfobacteriota bacterium]|nr:class I SAM-dependent methyltransferase [Thermodesulfobacteriota bacterium]